MNKKKYMTIGAFAVVIAIALGIAYYFDPAAINNIIGINSTEINAISDADMPALDGTSSSLPVVASETSTDAAAPAPAAAKKPAQKKNNIAGPAAAPAQTSASQGEAVASSSSQSPTAATGDILNDGDLDDASYAAAAATSTPPSCSFPGVAPSSTRKIIFNEIAWMGSPSSSAAEWMEIKNNSADDIDLSGWELMNASGKIKILFSAGDTISSGGLLLLSRGSASGSATANASNAATGAVTTPATKIYSGDLVNTGDVLALMDPQCDVSDYLDASRGWPGGNNTTKQTLERDADGVGWHTSALPGGTPGVENSAGPPPAQYKLTVAFEGNAAGATIASDPAGLICSASCTGSYASGTRMTLTPAAGANAAFNGWNGLCYGEITCSFTIAANTSLIAAFRSTLVAATPDGAADNNDIPSLSDGITTSSSPAGDGGNDTANSGNDGESSDGNTSSTASSITAASHILIAAIQIAGASSSNDFVKLYNPTAAAVDMSGWKLHKKSQTGTDYSLKEFPAGSTIAAGQSFVWANSENGFSDSVGANVSSTETLSADNSVALMDAAGNIIDAVAWGTGTGQYGEGPPYPTSPGANQLLSRRSSGGVMVDTDNNTNDFIIQ